MVCCRSAVALLSLLSKPFGFSGLQDWFWAAKGQKYGNFRLHVVTSLKEGMKAETYNALASLNRGFDVALKPAPTSLIVSALGTIKSSVRGTSALHD